MKLNQPLVQMRGIWRFTFFEGDLERDDEGIIFNPVVVQKTYENLITSVGKQAVLDRLFGLASVAAVSQTGIGTSATAAAVGNTSLTGAVYKAFDALPIRTGLSAVAITTFGTSEGNINIQEAALSIGAGTILLNRLAPIGPFNKTSAVSLRIETTVSQA